MSRHIVALIALTFVGAVLAVPDPSFAGGMRGAMPGAGLRAPLIIQRNAAAGLFRPRAPFAALPRAGRLIAAPRFAPQAHQGVRHSVHGFARTTLGHPRARLVRRDHRDFRTGWIYPVTIGEDTGYGYIGTPYDPGDAVPVYGPPPPPLADDAVDPPAPARALVPRLSSAREDNQDACRSERVTVPASEGEREITVVRC